jgi:hypothetical protein
MTAQAFGLLGFFLRPAMRWHLMLAVLPKIK